MTVLKHGLVLFAVAGMANGKETGSCGSDKPSTVSDCQNVDMGSCGNACCKMSFSVPDEPLTAMQKLNTSLSNGGPDGYFTLQMTAEGTLGFGDLRPFKIPSGEQFIGQVHHMTSGPKHYVDTVNFNIKPQRCADGEALCKSLPPGHKYSSVKAFSTSLIGGALGDNGQNYKNIMMAMKAAWSDADMAGVAHYLDESCHAAQVVV